MTATVTRLRAPLAVWTDVAICDRGQHELTITTDGTRAYVSGPTTDSTLVSRDGTKITVDCGEWCRHDAPCEGQVTFDIADHTAGRWTADAVAIGWVMDFGVVIDLA